MVNPLSSGTPRVTVVTPSLNQGEFIRATIESVLSQDYPNLEYIVMDGGSTDQTAAVVQDYSSRLRFISEPDRGQSDAINKGFRMGSGELLAWLNSDDIFLPGAVHSAVAGFLRNPAAGLVYGEGYQMDRDDRERRRFPCTQAPDLWRLVHLSDYVLQQSAWFRRDALDRVGYLDENLHYVMDWDLLIRIGLRFPFAHIPEYLGCIREYPEAKTFSGGARRIAEIRQIMQRYTGRRLAPGTIVYGLETLRERWKGRIREATPGWLRPLGSFAERSVETAANVLIGRTIYHSQGLYPDGWVAPVFRWMLPAGSGNVVLEGEAPGGTHGLAGQRVRVECNGQSVLRVALPEGPFRLEVPVPAAFADRPLHFVVRSRRSVWSNWKHPVAGRRICWRLADFRRAETEQAGDADLRPAESVTPVTATR